MSHAKDKFTGNQWDVAWHCSLPHAFFDGFPTVLIKLQRCDWLQGVNIKGLTSTRSALDLLSFS